jgi:Leucine-rich repeat (LRR) protein
LAYRSVAIKDTLVDSVRRVQKLSLSGKSLTKMPDIIGNLTQLKFCDLSNNQLASIPAAIGQCTHLEQLKLNHNRLTTIPATIGNCTALTLLLLDNNFINTLPSELMNCTGFLENNSMFTVDTNKLCPSAQLSDSMVTWIANVGYSGLTTWQLTTSQTCP